MNYLYLIILNLCSFVIAHSGRTDSSGGHYNRSTGKYHHHGSFDLIDYLLIAVIIFCFWLFNYVRKDEDTPTKFKVKVVLVGVGSLLAFIFKQSL